VFGLAHGNSHLAYWDARFCSMPGTYSWRAHQTLGYRKRKSTLLGMGCLTTAWRWRRGRALPSSAHHPWRFSAQYALHGPRPRRSLSSLRVCSTAKTTSSWKDVEAQSLVCSTHGRSRRWLTHHFITLAPDSSSTGGASHTPAIHCLSVG
jgi:hypothetical protein